jgi:hypothetical protein
MALTQSTGDEMAKPSLRANVDTTNAQFGRNLNICFNQAKEAQRLHALEAAKHRKIKPSLADWHFQGYDESTSIMDWVNEAKELVNRCPVIRDEQLETNGDKSENGSATEKGNGNGKEMVVDRA